MYKRCNKSIQSLLSLSLHHAFWSLLIIHTNKCTFYNIINSKIHIKIHIKTFKMLLHVSILRSSSGSIHCSLLNLYSKTISELLRYINPVMWQHVVCLYVRSTLCRERRCALQLTVCWPAANRQSTAKVLHMYKHMTRCQITGLI
jgi:hypothetical protein